MFPSARVANVRAESYSIDLRPKINNLVELLGGWNSFIQPGERVLLKPNLLSARTPERAVTTHPAVVRAVAESLMSFGARVAIGDSPGGAARGVERVFVNTGMLELAESLGIEWINFEASGVEKVRTKYGYEIFITKALRGFDKVVSISKLKTHSFMLYTGAVKNHFGLVPGFRKSVYHKLYPKPQAFASLIVAICEETRADLHIMDAIIGMEGNGPASGKSREVGMLFASDDPVALDRVAEQVIGIGEGKVLTTSIAHSWGVGTGKLADIEILGLKLEDIVLEKSFDLPPRIPLTMLERFVPNFLITGLAKLVWIRPTVSREKCLRCGVCAENCPMNAITLKHGDYPLFDYKKCSSCLCCHELCPYDAIELERSRLARLVR